MGVTQIDWIVYAPDQPRCLRARVGYDSAAFEVHEEFLPILGRCGLQVKADPPPPQPLQWPEFAG